MQALQTWKSSNRGQQGTCSNREELGTWQPGNRRRQVQGTLSLFLAASPALALAEGAGAADAKLERAGTQSSGSSQQSTMMSTLSPLGTRSNRVKQGTRQESVSKRSVSFPLPLLVPFVDAQ
jgi:hypothetical protein